MLAIIAVGVLAVVVSQPKEGTVEYHLREYRRAERELMANTWRDRCGIGWSMLTGKPYVPSIDMNDPNNPLTRWEKHEQALIALGCWEKREFYLTYKSGAQIGKNLESLKAALPQDERSQVWYAPQTKQITIRSRRADMPKWEEMIRKVDVPENGK